MKNVYLCCEPNGRRLVFNVHSKITFSIARNVIMIGLLSNAGMPGGNPAFGLCLFGSGAGHDDAAYLQRHAFAAGVGAHAHGLAEFAEGLA
jgi:hypothetical protein